MNFIFKKIQLTKQKNISYHYDLGNDFYKEWLDESMTYSSALFKNKNLSLYDAQKQKYDSIIENLSIKIPVIFAK